MLIECICGFQQLLASLVVWLSALILSAAGLIYWLCTGAFWPASHSAGETDSTQCHAYMMQAPQTRPPNDFVKLDNAASGTYLSVFKLLRNPVPCDGLVTSANGVRSRSTHVGSLGKLPTVLYSPGMVFNLLFQRDLEKSQLVFHYKERVCSIYKKNIREPIIRIMVSEDVPYKMIYSDAEYPCNHLDTPSLVANLVQQNMTHYADYKHDDMSTLIHGRLIHMNMGTIKLASRREHLKGLEKYLPKLSRQRFCRFCAMSRPYKGHHENDKYNFGEYLYSDVCGLFRVRTKSGCRYFVTYINGETRYAWVFLLKRKSEQASVYKNLVTNILPKYGVKVKKLLSDNGGEYTAEDYVLLCHRNGIETLQTSAHSSERNGICERFNRTLVEALRNVLLTSRMA
jgi:Integrase core domain